MFQDHPEYDLENWYLNIARNIRQYGKPAFNNESGREKRHENDDPIHRRKQAWLFSSAGCFWTWHSWDGCEGINDTSYFADGWKYLKPMKTFFDSIPFWKFAPNYTVCRLDKNDTDFVFTAMATPDRNISFMYCCAKESNLVVENKDAIIRLKDGTYTIKFINPADLSLLNDYELVSGGLQNEYKINLPKFKDDIIVKISIKNEKDKTLIDGTL